MKIINIFILIFISFYVSSEEVFGSLSPDFQSGYSPSLSETEGGLWLVFDDAEKAIKHSPNRINDPGLNSYIKDVICKLSNEFCDGIRAYIVRTPHFNATMAPNGMMSVWSGLLLRMRNEAQLATVLGHEIGHYLKRHSLKRFEDAKNKSTFLTFLTLGIYGATATGNLNPNVGRAVIDITQFTLIASIFAFTRDEEREADKFGIQLLHNAELNINEAAKIWQNLIDEEAAGDDDLKLRSIFFASHPNPTERVQNLKSHATALGKYSQISTNKNYDIYWENIGPYMDMLLKDEINMNKFDKSEHLFKSLINDQIMLGTVYYHLGELYRLRKKEGDIALAQENYKHSLEQENFPPSIHRSLGLLYYKDKKMDLATEQFERYLELSPDANDREMIEFYIKFGG